MTRHFSITPCYLVVREGQRHCRHERRREGVKERREGVPGVAIRRINIGIQPQVAGARDISLEMGGDGFLNINFTKIHWTIENFLYVDLSR